MNLSIDATSEPVAPLVPKPMYSPSSFINNNAIEFSDAYDLIQESKKEKNKIMATRIAGGFEKYCNLLVEKHWGKKLNVKENCW